MSELLRSNYIVNSLRKVSRIIDTSHSTVSRWMNFFLKAPRKMSQKKLDKPEILNAIELFIKTPGQGLDYNHGHLMTIVCVT
jgi:hypothetical protein